MATHSQRYGTPRCGVTDKTLIDVGPVPVVTADQRAKALALLAAHDAIDLADMLGLTDEEKS
jgi:hypothetical protein